MSNTEHTPADWGRLTAERDRLAEQVKTLRDALERVATLPVPTTGRSATVAALLNYHDRVAAVARAALEGKS